MLGVSKWILMRGYRMWLEIQQVLDQLSSDPSVRIVTGAGSRAFTAGLDVKQATTELFSDRGPTPRERHSIFVTIFINFRTV
jgi:enoyl-CoA hydratase/carnithine racemase